MSTEAIALNVYAGFGSNLNKLVINYKNMLKSHYFLYSADNNSILVGHTPHDIEFMGLSWAIPSSIMEEENYQ